MKAVVVPGLDGSMYLFTTDGDPQRLSRTVRVVNNTYIILIKPKSKVYMRVPLISSLFLMMMIW